MQVTIEPKKEVVNFAIESLREEFQKAREWNNEFDKVSFFKSLFKENRESSCKKLFPHVRMKNGFIICRDLQFFKQILICMNQGRDEFIFTMNQNTIYNYWSEKFENA